jgi:L-ascorbate metabolism protein UlaG (beta-lactamase superfamily)
MYYLLLLILVAAGLLFSFLNSSKFGALPSGKRLDYIQKAPNYEKGQFQNQSPTPNLAEDATLLSVMKKFFFGKSKANKPPGKLPSQKTDLHALVAGQNVLVWFGHSSYFMQLDGKKILVDPVFSGAASPIRSTTRSFEGSDVYTVDDMPEIDLLFLSHDHWDHLDYRTIARLKPKVKTIITGLGTGAHLEHWGFGAQMIIEKNWYDHVDLGQGFTVDFTPARHFSGRSFKRNAALWTAFVLQTPSKKIYIGGDSGFDKHFAETGERFGPFDLAILECGQYNSDWRYIHTLPEEMIPTAKALKAKVILPVHWAKFALALHAWDEPVKKLLANAAIADIPVWTPMIGEKINLDAPQVFSNWWETVV